MGSSWIMYRYFSRFIVTFLVLLGDSALAAEYRSDTQNKNSTGSYSAKLTLSEHAEHRGVKSQAYNTQQDQQALEQTPLNTALYVTSSAIIPAQLNYTAFSPRAPPSVTHSL